MDYKERLWHKIGAAGKMAAPDNTAWAALGRESKAKPMPKIISGVYFPSRILTAALLTAGISAAITHSMVSTPIVVKLYMNEYAHALA